MLILDLPAEVLKTILNCLSYDEVSHCRLVLDEMFRVLRYADSMQTPIEGLDSYDMLDEMRDLSLMAREHFRENIAPGLNKKQEENKHYTSVRHLRPTTSPSQLHKLPSLVDKLSKKYSYVMSEIASLKIKKKELRKVERRIEQFAADCTKKLAETEKTLAEQRTAIFRQDMKLFDQELKIEKLAKLVEEMQEVGNARTAHKSDSTTGAGRGRNGGRETAIVTRSSKRKLRQNPSDKASTRGRKKSRRS